MTWATPISDLRTILSDGPLDKLRANKAVMGNQNGINAIFKTFEYRRQNYFNAASTVAPLGVYQNGILIAPSAFTFDDIVTGYFSLAPSSVGPNDQLTATYYVQWFLDSELDFFLQQASMWLGQTSDYTDQTPDGLKDACLKHACHNAYNKLALRHAEDLNMEQYRTQDAKDEKRMDIVGAYQNASKAAFKAANDSRNDYYTRKGQPLAPAFGVVVGNVRNPTRG
jgi:hypothetical protein